MAKRSKARRKGGPKRRKDRAEKRSRYERNQKRDKETSTRESPTSSEAAYKEYATGSAEDPGEQVQTDLPRGVPGGSER